MAVVGDSAMGMAAVRSGRPACAAAAAAAALVRPYLTHLPILQAGQHRKAADEHDGTEDGAEPEDEEHMTILRRERGCAFRRG
jgi:hypothetical protein